MRDDERIGIGITESPRIEILKGYACSVASVRHATDRAARAFLGFGSGFRQNETSRR
jgi:hypothetical protein